MATKGVKKQVAVGSATDEVKLVESDPFAAKVEQPLIKKQSAKKASAKASVKSKAGKTTAGRSAKTVSLDPFAGVAAGTSLTRKPPTKMKKAVAKMPSTPGAKVAKKGASGLMDEITAPLPQVELSASFKVLAEPELPELPRENRARLLMQSPTSLYFYWSIRENPYHLLRDAFGGETGSYMLVLKLRNLGRDTEEIFPADAEGNWWFDVESDGRYQAEIGFYAPNRPYFRIVYSNIVETPRRRPSQRTASEADWKVSANKFAEVLDISGFSSDAFEVAMAGDNQIAAESITHAAFSRFVGARPDGLRGIEAEDIRYAMIALASGMKFEDLRGKISHDLAAILQENAEKLTASKALNALSEYFDVDEAEFSEGRLGGAVYGASLLHFPRTLKTRSLSPRYSPIGSHSYGTSST